MTDYLEAIENEIAITQYGTSPETLYKPIEYLMGLGGKRMRPCLTLLAANLWLYKWQKAIRPAVAIEVFHNFTLMHDDIMDQAPLRRGKTTVHEKWNANTAILSGDVMLVAAYELLADVEDKHLKRVIKRFNKTAAEVCKGQQLDMDYASLEHVSKEEYIDMIRLKTSVLLGYALEMGGIIADADNESIAALNEIGTNMGLGFQLMDDVLDVYGDPAKFGKQIGGDIIENKKTWLWIDAKENVLGTEWEKEWEKCIADGYKPEQKVEKVRNIYSELGVKERALECAEAYFEIAEKAVNKLQVSDDKKDRVRKFIIEIKNRVS